MHASKLRPQAKRDAWKRQLLALAIVAMADSITPRSFAQAASQPTARDELRAAKLVEMAIFSHAPSAAEREKLEKIYADLVLKFPEDAEVRNARAEFFWTTGDAARALAEWHAAELLDPKNAIVLDHLGASYLAAGEVKNAAAFYRRAAASDPPNARYHFAFANTAFLFRHELHTAGQLDSEAVLAEALAHFAEASRLDPLNADYARAYAETFYIVSKPDWHAAIAAWEHFARITPQHDFALTNLARVHLSLGQKAEARACLSQVRSAEFQRMKARLSERIDAE